MDLGLNGRCAMVAAASKGLGRAIAESLLREGCRVSIASRSAANLEKTQNEIEAAIPKAAILAVACDVTKAEDLRTWHHRTVSAFGDVEILVTNTGGPPAARFLDLSEDQWRAGVDAVLLNVVRLSRLVLPGMQKRKWGRIVHVTSWVAKQPMDILTISSTLRAGLSALTKTMSNQLAPDNILVNAVLPGHVMTDRQIELNAARAKDAKISVEEYVERAVKEIPLRRHAQPRELADAVAFLCGVRASYITGVSLQVDGGITRGTF
jgi:3-oxoacyl-[acyl-carrier protein] reductase